MTLRKYSGSLRSSNASMILSHLAVLNAFRTSKPIYSTRAFCAPATTNGGLGYWHHPTMASIVDRPFLKPNWLSDKPPTCCIAASSLTDMIRSNNFPAISNMQSGRYADGSSGSLFLLGRSTNLVIFYYAGIISSLRHALKVSLNIEETFKAAVFIANAGTPSSPGAFLMAIF